MRHNMSTNVKTVRSCLTVYALGSGLGSPRYRSENAEARWKKFQLILAIRLILITRVVHHPALVLLPFRRREHAFSLYHIQMYSPIYIFFNLDTVFICNSKLIECHDMSHTPLWQRKGSQIDGKSFALRYTPP